MKRELIVLPFNDSFWRVSKLADRRLYVIGGESPNKNWGF